MDISSGIASAKAAIEIGKAVKNINKSYDEAVYKATITDLTEKLSDAKLALIEANALIIEKDREISALKSLKIERGNLVEGEGGYQYRANEVGNPVGFPMCPKCDPIGGRLIPLVENKRGNAAKCPACGSEFEPVTCYQPAGGTLREQQIAERNRKSQEMNYRVISARNKPSWMK